VEEPSYIVLTGLLLLSGTCFMPTIGLLNSIVFKHVSKAPYVFVFGTLGWIVVNLVVAGCFGGEKEPYFFLVGGAVGVFLALYSLTLPHTPPKGAPAPGEKSGGGAGVLSLFKNVQFTIFVVCVFFASIPCNNYFFPSIVNFLSERGYPSPVALNTLCQFSEIFLMFALAFCVPRIGLKNVLLIGLAAWWIRYLCFASPYYDFECTMAGLLVHGFCFAFLYVASYMYADKVAPPHLKASAQTMMVFLLLGVSQVCGSFTLGHMTDTYKSKLANPVVAKSQLLNIEGNVPDEKFTASVPIPEWSDSADSPFQYFNLPEQLNNWLGEDHPYDFAKQLNVWLGKVKEGGTDSKKVDLGKLLEGKPLTSDAIGAMQKDVLVQTGVKVSQLTIADDVDVVLVNPITADVQYTQADLTNLARDVAEAVEKDSSNFELTRADWLKAQAKDWTIIYGYPAVFILVFFVIFAIFGREPKEEKA
jgi:hypothetical protein